MPESIEIHEMLLTDTVLLGFIATFDGEAADRLRIRR